MNANELADALQETEPYYSTDYKLFDQAATMLRQQQAEIQALKGDGKVCARCGAIAYDPVITQTANTLTDEEIEEVFRTVEQDFALTESKKSDGGWRNFPVELGRAILRKAQGK